MKKLPLYVALDVDDREQALFVVRETAPYVEGFKIGPRLLLRYGTDLIPRIKPSGKVFLDLKFFDIPSTMLSAVESAFDMGADMVTVHAQAGEEALKMLAVLEARLKAKRPFRILAVTVLTSLQQNNLPPLAKPHSVLSHVESLTDMLIKSGLKGMVCSGHEVAHLRKRHPSAHLLIPGLRPRVGGDKVDATPLSDRDALHVSPQSGPQDEAPASDRDALHVSPRVGGDKVDATPLSDRDTKANQDQKRVWTPEQALRAGANALVMGRPIYQSPDPAKTCAQLLHDIQKGFTKQ